MSDTVRHVGDDETGSNWTNDFKRVLHYERTKVTATYTREGSKAALEAALPAIGAAAETIATIALSVTGVELADAEGDTAKLTVSAEAQLDSTTTSTPLGEPVYEVDFVELRKKIEEHPCCGKLQASASTHFPDTPPTWEDWPMLMDNNWATATGIPTFWSSIGAWTLEDYLSMKKKGVEEFVMYLPVVTRSLTYLARPTGLGERSGTQSNPPTGSYSYISKYEWLLGEDGAVRRGDKYERKTKWMGAERIEGFLYPDWT
jgi:hypothetical protein